MAHFPLEEIKRLRALNAELLEACKELLKAIPDNSVASMREAIDEANRAITKAERG